MLRAVQVAPSASFTAATSSLVTAILPNSHHSIPVPYVDIALAKWSQDHNGPPPLGQVHTERRIGMASVVQQQHLLSWIVQWKRSLGQDFWQ